MQDDKQQQEPYPTDPDECRRSALAFVESFDPDEWVRSIDKTWSVEVGEKNRVGVFRLTHPVVDVGEYRKSEQTNYAFINAIRPKGDDLWMDSHDHVLSLCTEAIAFLKRTCIASLWIKDAFEGVAKAIKDENWAGANVLASGACQRDREIRDPEQRKFLSPSRLKIHPPAWQRFLHDLDVLIDRSQGK